MLLVSRARSVNIEHFITVWDRNSPQCVPTSFRVFHARIAIRAKISGKKKRKKKKAFRDRLLIKTLGVYC